MSIYKTKIVQEVRALTIMADDLSSIPKSYTMEGKNQLQVALWLSHVYCDMHAKIHTHNQNTLK